MKLTWWEWLREPTDWSGVTTLPRHKGIKLFVKEGLVPLLQDRGYRLRGNAQELYSKIANGLYENEGKSHVESNWSFGHLNTDYIQEEKWHFYDVLDSLVWEDFWNYWGQWSEFSEESERGLDRRYDIEAYVWTQINVEGSPQTKYILSRLGIAGDTMDGGSHIAGRIMSGDTFKGEDTYLREAAESGEYDGYRR